MQRGLNDLRLEVWDSCVAIPYRDSAPGTFVSLWASCPLPVYPHTWAMERTPVPHTCLPAAGPAAGVQAEHSSLAGALLVYACKGTAPAPVSGNETVYQAEARASGHGENTGLRI